MRKYSNRASSLACALAIAALPASAFAQGAMLAQNLRTLASDPRNLYALLGAGRAALDAGDANAALGFFARASEVDPRNGAAKAGGASALVVLERGDEALRLFAEAQALGVPERDLAKDRGLAYDLRGDGARAQRDYRLALQGGPDDEVTRRLALSYGIGGNRAAAMTLLDPLLRRQDQAAWRARAFILAMNGDMAGASHIVRTVMPPNLAGSIEPFIARLPGLNTVQRAHAVNFGTIPAGLPSYAYLPPVAAPVPAPPPVTASVAGERRLIPTGPALGSGSAASAPRKPRIRLAPGERIVTAAEAEEIRRRIASGRSDERLRVIRVAPAAAKPVPQATPASEPEPLPPPIVRTAQLDPEVLRRRDAPLPAPTPPPVEDAVDAAATPAFEVAQPVVVARPSASRPAPVSTRPSGLAGILDGITPEAETAAPLPTVGRVRVRPAEERAPALAEPAAKPAPDARALAAKAAADKKAAAAKAASAKQAAEAKAVAAKVAAEKAAAKRNPSRTWVQIASGPNAKALPYTWNKLKKGSGKLATQAAWTMPFKSTNRLLVGPMKSAADARALVNALAKDGVPATTFQSEAGQEIAKLGGK